MKTPMRLAALILFTAAVSSCNLFNGPSMEVKQGSTIIQNGGSFTVSSTGAITFTAVNTGISTIEFNGSPNRVNVSGSPSFYLLSGHDLPSSLDGGKSADFQINCSGSGTATVAIPNNKGNDFTFTIKR